MAPVSADRRWPGGRRSRHRHRCLLCLFDGHDPAADWLTPPFQRDRNPLLVAAQSGFGTVDLKDIDFAPSSSHSLKERSSAA